MSTSRTRSRRSNVSACAKAACGTGGLLSVVSKEDAYALGGQSSKCPTASCPAYTGVAVFLLVLYGFFVSLLWAFRPGFVLKAGADAADPNSVDLMAGFLYSLLFTALVLVAVALVIRCRGCNA